jgi:phosphohistidine swiveling domain-containing protein
MTSSRPEQKFPAPGEIEGFWAWDKIHAPRPLTPLAGSTIPIALADGFTIGQADFGCPLGLEFRMFNHYAFAAFYPILDETKETLAGRAARYQENLESLVPQVGRLWEEEWLPSILPALERARSTDYRALSDAGLIASLDEHMTDQVYRWTIHGRINFILIAASRFADFYKEIVHPEDETEGYEALQGFETVSVNAGRGLWRLSRIVKQNQALANSFHQLDPAALLAVLESTADGRSFLAELADYLDRFGWRTDACYEIADKTWREDPSIALNTLQGYLALGDDADPDVHFRNSVTKREALLAKARQAAANDPEKHDRLEELYEAARRNIQVTEDHNYHIDQYGVQLMRLPVLEAGSRLADRGLINEQDDVFYLLFDELKDALQDGRDRKDVVAERKASYGAACDIVPPLNLGTPPPISDDPFVDALMVRMLGPVFEPDREPDILRGVPASPGVIQGTAKVVLNLAEASKLQQGDIMVCPMTLPPWTPLFSTVSGVVADTGGILSHCAIVAREYRLPAVVGTVIGTRTIKDGMKITVDGSKGIVRVESRA